MTDMNKMQSIPLYSIRNARELGGYITSDGRRIRNGVLLRTANLSQLSNEDKLTLTDSFHLQHIIDFRMPMEVDGAEDPPISGAEYHHLDVLDQEKFMSQGDPKFDFSSMDLVQLVNHSVDSGIQNEYMYIGFLTGTFGLRAYSEFFRILLSADPDRAVLWHCTSGKDRTGLAAMLLLSAFGVEESVILQDHVLTNEYNAERIEATRHHLTAQGYDDVFIKNALIMLDAVDVKYMINAIAHLKRVYGSVSGFIQNGLNITADEIDLLKEKYLV